MNPHRTHRLALGPVIVLVAVAAVLPEASQSRVVDRVVAVVGTRMITLSDVKAATLLGLLADPPAAEADLIERLIDRELMRVEVDRYSPPPPPDAAVDEAVARLAARFPSAEAFAAAARSTAMTPERLRSHVRDDLRIARYLDDRFGAAATPTDDEVQRSYQERATELAVGGRVPPFAEVEPEVRAHLIAARRERLIGEWLAGLKRRADIRRPAG